MKVKYLVMDVDGTLTDGKIYMGGNGELCKAFNIKDGCGIHDLLPTAGISPVIITGRTSEILEKRCREIGITELFQGIRDKLEQLDDMLAVSGHQYCNVAYIGDDINDLPCMKAVKEAGGLIGCPHDATGQVREIADFVSEKSGGDGAVRDFIEWILSQQ